MCLFRITPFGYIIDVVDVFIPDRGIVGALLKFVKQRRKLVGLTQVELAEKDGVGLRFIRDLEQGKESVHLDKVNFV